MQRIRPHQRPTRRPPSTGAEQIRGSSLRRWTAPDKLGVNTVESEGGIAEKMATRRWVLGFPGVFPRAPDKVAVGNHDSQPKAWEISGVCWSPPRLGAWRRSRLWGPRTRARRSAAIARRSFLLPAPERTKKLTRGSHAPASRWKEKREGEGESGLANLGYVMVYEILGRLEK